MPHPFSSMHAVIISCFPPPVAASRPKLESALQKVAAVAFQATGTHTYVRFVDLMACKATPRALVWASALAVVLALCCWFPQVGAQTTSGSVAEEAVQECQTEFTSCQVRLLVGREAALCPLIYFHTMYKGESQFVEYWTTATATCIGFPFETPETAKKQEHLKQRVSERERETERRGGRSFKGVWCTLMICYPATIQYSRNNEYIESYNAPG